MEITPFLATVKSIIEAQIERDGNTNLTEQQLATAFDSASALVAKAFQVVIDEKLRKSALKILMSQIAVRMEHGSALVSQDPHQPWLDTRNLPWECWKAYETSLHQNGLPKSVALTLGHDTSRILDLCGDPASLQGWDRRGLVLGHVQSGKTSNYSGLLCRAADSGYKLFIVIAGIHENLRAQTQQRINSAFIDLAPPAMRPISLTTTTSDFARSSAEQRIPPQGVGTSLVLVVKKNAKILENLLVWLNDNSRPGSDWADMPLLLIDDEADNASVNTNRPDESPTRINALIRSILNLFKKSSYIGYTATPFANIFIDPERNDDMMGQELFPRHFIYCLEAPDNYVGPDRIFGSENDNSSMYLRTISISEEDTLPRSHKSSFEPDQLPQSLKEALQTFLIACAIRAESGAEQAHASMLINVSPFAQVQRKIGILAEHYLNELRRWILAGAAVPGKDQDFWNHLQELFTREHSNCGLAWPQIRQTLPRIAPQIKLRVINSHSPDRLDYSNYTDSGLKVIAVGGYTLSRGLTLENLMVSYWKRNSKAYDTLLQMGRWFGYRGGYDDLCRIWMPATAQGWYEHISDVTAELRADLIDMARRGMTPEDFGLKVRNHPETLIVTAHNKMRAAETRVVRPDLAGRLLETHIVYNDNSILEQNLRVTEGLVKALPESSAEHMEIHDGGACRLWKKAPHHLVRNFFHNFRAHHHLLHADNDYLFAWLSALESALAKRGETLLWDIQLISLLSGQDVPFAGFRIRPQRRTVGGRLIRTAEGRPAPEPWDPTTDPLKDGWRIGNKQRVASRGIERFPLSEPQRRTVEQAAKAKGKKNVPDLDYRKILSRPLLTLHIIDLTTSPADGNETEPLLHRGVVAWGASFPAYEKLSINAHEYTVNKVWLEQFEQDEDPDNGED